MQEIKAVATGTRCSQFLFSVSLNPPLQENVHADTFEGAINQIEERNNLTGQPRIIVFHEKEGRRHAHAVWSRIDAETMTARNLPHFKMKLQDISRQLYRDNGWDMPDGMRDKKLRDPRNFTLAEWQQATRIGHAAKDLKIAMQDAWNISDSQKAFARALEDRGMFLARGDKRGHVAITYSGEALSIARYTGKKAKEVRERLGKPDSLRSVTERQAHIADFMTPTVKKHLHDHRFKMHKEMSKFMTRRETMAEANRHERTKLEQAQQARWAAETKTRAIACKKDLKASGKR